MPRAESRPLPRQISLLVMCILASSCSLDFNKQERDAAAPLMRDASFGGGDSGSSGGLPCGSGKCHPAAACVEREGTLACVCPDGYDDLNGDGSDCKDRNECDNGVAACHANADCVNRPGGFECNCKPGFNGDGVRTCDGNRPCADMAGSNCSPLAKCEEAGGSRLCVCGSGYSGNGEECADTDECQQNHGGCDTSPLATCSNLVASAPKCTCPEGFTGSGVGPDGCVDIDECSVPSTCSPEFPCVNRPNGQFYYCRGQFPEWENVGAVGPYAAANGTVTDFKTGLMWQQKVYLDGSACGGDKACQLVAGTCGTDATCNLAESRTFCMALELGGFDDWRLPTVAESLSLVDPSKENPAMNKNAFPDYSGASEWAFTAPDGRPINFATGAVRSVPDTIPLYVRCVR